MVKFEVKNMRAVGMHHHGPTSLFIGGLYFLLWEPENPEDFGNATAIHDKQGKCRAYLTRKDAAIISTLFYGNSIEGVVKCMPIVSPHVEKQKLGPQQECVLTFEVCDRETDFVSYVLTSRGCSFVKY